MYLKVMFMFGNLLINRLKKIKNIYVSKIVSGLCQGFFANIWFFFGQIGTSLDKLETSH